MTFRMALAEVTIEDMAQTRGIPAEVLRIAIRTHRRARDWFEVMCPTDRTVRHYAEVLLEGTERGRLAQTIGLTDARRI